MLRVVTKRAEAEPGGSQAVTLTVRRGDEVVQTLEASLGQTVTTGDLPWGSYTVAASAGRTGGWCRAVTGAEPHLITLTSASPITGWVRSSPTGRGVVARVRLHERSTEGGPHIVAETWSEPDGRFALDAVCDGTLTAQHDELGCAGCTLEVASGGRSVALALSDQDDGRSRIEVRSETGGALDAWLEWLWEGDLICGRTSASSVHAIATPWRASCSARVGADGHQVADLDLPAVRSVHTVALKRLRGTGRLVCDRAGACVPLARLTILRREGDELESIARLSGSLTGELFIPDAPTGAVYVVAAEGYAPAVFEGAAGLPDRVILDQARLVHVRLPPDLRAAGGALLHATARGPTGAVIWDRTQRVDGGPTAVADLPRSDLQLDVHPLGQTFRYASLEVPSGATEVTIPSSSVWRHLRVAFGLPVAFDGATINLMDAGRTLATATIRGGGATFWHKARRSGRFVLERPAQGASDLVELPESVEAVVQVEVHGARAALPWIVDVVEATTGSAIGEGHVALSRIVDGAAADQATYPLSAGRNLVRLADEGQYQVVCTSPGYETWNSGVLAAVDLVRLHTVRLHAVRRVHVEWEARGLEEVELWWHPVSGEAPDGILQRPERIQVRSAGEAVRLPRERSLLVWSASRAAGLVSAPRVVSVHEDRLRLDFGPGAGLRLRFGPELRPGAALSVWLEFPSMGLGVPHGGAWQRLPLREMTKFLLEQTGKDGLLLECLPPMDGVLCLWRLERPGSVHRVPVSLKPGATLDLTVP